MRWLLLGGGPEVHMSYVTSDGFVVVGALVLGVSEDKLYFCIAGYSDAERFGFCIDSKIWGWEARFEEGWPWRVCSKSASRTSHQHRHVHEAEPRCQYNHPSPPKPKSVQKEERKVRVRRSRKWRGHISIRSGTAGPTPLNKTTVFPLCNPLPNFSLYSSNLPAST